MISIRHHLSNSFYDPDTVLNEKAQAVWRYLNKENVVGAGAVRGKSITKRAQEFLTIVESHEHACHYSRPAARRHSALLKALLNDGTLEKLITSGPRELDALADTLSPILANADFEKCGTHAAFSELLQNKVFNYKAYRDSDFCSSLYIELKFTTVTCPYCNEYPVKVILRSKGKDKKPILHFDLDHFYPKNKYPFLALSFYNHIPSCKYCNSLHKQARPFTIRTHTHPYLDNFDSLSSFSYSHGALIGRDVNSVSINNTTPNALNLCGDLKLEERYQQNIGYAKINQLVRILADNADLFIDEEEESVTTEFLHLKMRLADFGLTHDASRIMEQPWSKMQRDLVKFFDVNNIILRK